MISWILSYGEYAMLIRCANSLKVFLGLSVVSFFGGAYYFDGQGVGEGGGGSAAWTIDLHEQGGANVDLPYTGTGPAGEAYVTLLVESQGGNEVSVGTGAGTVSAAGEYGDVFDVPTSSQNPPDGGWKLNVTYIGKVYDPHELNTPADTDSCSF